MMSTKEWIGLGSTLALSAVLALVIRRYPAAIWPTSFVVIAIALSMFQQSRVIALSLIVVTIAFLVGKAAAARWPAAPLVVALAACLGFIVLLRAGR